MMDCGFDDTDERILALLRENSRTSVTEIARCVGLTDTPCRLRIKRLRDSGRIKKYTILEGGAGSVKSTKFLLIESKANDDATSAKIENILKSHVAITSIYTLEGSYDYMAIIEEIEKDRTKNIIKDLRNSFCVTSTTILPAMEQIYSARDVLDTSQTHSLQKSVPRSSQPKPKGQSYPLSHHKSDGSETLEDQSRRENQQRTESKKQMF